MKKLIINDKKDFGHSKGALNQYLARYITESSVQ